MPSKFLEKRRETWRKHYYSTIKPIKQKKTKVLTAEQQAKADYQRMYYLKYRGFRGIPQKCETDVEKIAERNKNHDEFSFTVELA